MRPTAAMLSVLLIGLSADLVSSHLAWAAGIKDTQGYAPNYPMIADSDLAVSKLYGMLPASSGATSDGRTAAGNQTVWSVFVDLEGEFPAFPGMAEADELQMIDGFFTAVFGEDAATLRAWS
jgi:hypothetical protein